MRKSAIAIAIALALPLAANAGGYGSVRGGSASGNSSSINADGSHNLTTTIKGYNANMGASSGAGVGGSLVAVTPGWSHVGSQASSFSSVNGFAIVGAAGAAGQLGDGFGGIVVGGIGGDIESYSEADGSANTDLAFSHRSEADYQAFGTSELDLQVVDMTETLSEEYDDFTVETENKEWEVSWKSPAFRPYRCFRPRCPR